MLSRGSSVVLAVLIATFSLPPAAAQKEKREPATKEPPKPSDVFFNV
jgi:hypothetical protein